MSHHAPAAALVIQGSAFVYSKKVEYLYSLVFQALEYISAHKKRDAAAAAAAAASAAGSGSHDSNADDEMQPLDDVIESLCPHTTPSFFAVLAHSCALTWLPSLLDATSTQPQTPHSEQRD